MLERGAPAIVEQLMHATGTDLVGYLTEGPGFSTFVTDDEGTVYHTYSTTARGLEFLMAYYPILDRAPKGRNETDSRAQTWIRRHDEYRQRPASGAGRQVRSLLVLVRAPEANTRAHRTAPMMLTTMIHIQCLELAFSGRVASTIPRIRPIGGSATAVM